MDFMDEVDEVLKKGRGWALRAVAAWCAGFLLLAGLVQGQPPLKGHVLPLYSQDPGFDYTFAVKEIADTGANAVSLLVVLLQDDGDSTEIKAVPGRTVPEEVLRHTIREAHAEGLQVLLFPIVLLDQPKLSDWRGNLKPDDVDAWFASYTEWIVSFARLAEEEGCAWLSVGSEFSSLEDRTAHWVSVIGRVRENFPSGKLLYSCNWDHYDGPEAWWGEVDAVGLSSYYELTGDSDATQEELDAAWGGWKAEILAWHGEKTPGMPIILTEVGYPSIDGGAVYPWNYTRETRVDLDEQARAYRAFISAWDDAPELEGVFFYKWLGFEPEPERGYTPRGKPAEWLVRAWYGGLVGGTSAAGEEPLPPAPAQP